MEFFDYLVSEYGYNEPIIYSDITFKSYSKIWIKKSISKLCDEEKLIRFEKGVYYIPTETILGKSKLDSRKVINKKYINNGKETIGYYSGATLLNMLGLSTQMPNTLEIYTNNEQTRLREITVGKQKVLLRCSRANVSDDNVATMSFLELMNCTDSKFYDDEKKVILNSYIKENNISRKSISECSPYFPDKAMRTLVESEIIYSVTQ